MGHSHTLRLLNELQFYQNMKWCIQGTYLSKQAIDCRAVCAMIPCCWNQRPPSSTSSASSSNVWSTVRRPAEFVVTEVHVLYTCQTMKMPFAAVDGKVHAISHRNWEYRYRGWEEYFLTVIWVRTTSRRTHVFTDICPVYLLYTELQTARGWIVWYSSFRDIVA